VRVIEYQLEGVADGEPVYRLLTTVLDHEGAPAQELAALYHDRWEIENVFDVVQDPSPRPTSRATQQDTRTR